MRKLLAFILGFVLFFIVGFIGADVYETQRTAGAVDRTEKSYDGAPDTDAVASSGHVAAASADAVTAELLDSSFTVPDGYGYLTVAAASATSTIWQESIDNSPILLFDGSDESNWQEGVDGYGTGEYVEATLESQRAVRYFSFKLGNWRSEEYYEQNGRPSALTITLLDEDGTEVFSDTVSFSDAMQTHWVALSADVSARTVRLTIADVYTGTVYEDTCINEVGIYGY